MTRMRTSVCVAITSVTLAACGTATTPSPVTGLALDGSVTSLTIDGRDAVLTGKSVPYRVLDPGTRRVVAATWTSSDTSVATVDANGLVTALKHGSTRLEASLRGVTASKTVEVVNNFEGVWDGVGTIRRCDETGRFNHEWWPRCAGHSFVFMGQVYSWGGVGWRFVVVLRLAHSSDDARQVTGTHELYYLLATIYGHCDVYGGAIPLTGRVSDDGRLALAGSIGSLDGSEFTVANWDTELTTAREMRGQWVQGLTVPSGRNSWEVEVDLNAVPTPLSCSGVY